MRVRRLLGVNLFIWDTAWLFRRREAKRNSRKSEVLGVSASAWTVHPARRLRSVTKTKIRTPSKTASKNIPRRSGRLQRKETQKGRRITARRASALFSGSARRKKNKPAAPRNARFALRSPPREPAASEGESDGFRAPWMMPPLAEQPAQPTPQLYNSRRVCVSVAPTRPSVCPSKACNRNGECRRPARSVFHGQSAKTKRECREWSVSRQKDARRRGRRLRKRPTRKQPHVRLMYVAKLPHKAMRMVGTALLE